MPNDARAETTIAATPEAVFPWLVEPERIARWIGGTVECRGIEGGGVHQVVEQAGRRIEIDSQVTESRPPRRLVVQKVSPGLFDMTMTHELSAENGGTRLVISLSAELRSRMARLAAPLIARQVQAKLEEDVVRLKGLVEAAP